MDRLGPNGKVSKNRVYLSRWTTFFGWTGPIKIDRSISTHFQSQYLAVRYFPSVLLVHTCVVTTITKMCYAVYVLDVKNGLFPERISNILSLFESGVRRSLNLTGKNLQSAQNNPFYGINFYV